MSKELIEELRLAGYAKHADRIEELEREIERKMSAAFVLKERDALQADRDEWKARAEFSYRQRDELERECDEYKEAHRDLHKWRSGYRASLAEVHKQLDALANKIEELERTNQHLVMALADAEALEIGTAERCDALQADNSRLRGKLAYAELILSKEYNHVVPSIVKALSATPEQSLARIRNKVLEEAAQKAEVWKVQTVAKKIRSMKEAQ